MDRMVADVSGEPRVFLFCGPQCRTKMLKWWRDYLVRAEGGEDIRSIRVWATGGNKTKMVREWVRPRSELPPRLNALDDLPSFHDEAVALARLIAGDANNPPDPNDVVLLIDLVLQAAYQDGWDAGIRVHRACRRLTSQDDGIS